MACLFSHTAVRCLSRAALAAACVLATFGASAQVGGIEFEPSAEPLSCLTSIRPEVKLPAYPAGVPAGTDAVVRVTLKFGANDAPPSAEVTFNSGGEPFAAAVRDHVASYRLPCLRAGEQFEGVQEFQFVVRKSAPAILGSVPRESEGGALSSPECLAGIANASQPRFPKSSLANGTSGSVLVQLIFAASDRAPEVNVLYNGGDRQMESAVRDSVNAYRMKCIKPGDTPVSGIQVFGFRFEGEDTTRLKRELTLVQLLGLIQDLKAQRVRFDFTTMGCPFQLHVAPFQPYARNSVQQVGTPNLGRREFTEWLRNVTFAIPPSAMKTAIGQESTVSVPCLVLDLS